MESPDSDPHQRLQEELARRVVVPAEPLPALAPEDQLLALDVQYVGDVAHVGATLWSGADQELGAFSGQLTVEVPYVPGAFCFREGPPLLALVDALRRGGRADPALLLVDAHGLAHPRRFGAACWLGLACDLPTIGCAKETLLPYSGHLKPTRGGTLDVLLGKAPVGVALRTRDGVNPVFVSPGHRVSLAGAAAAVLALPGSYRVPDPLRRADQVARQRARGEHPAGVNDLGVLSPVQPPWDLAPPTSD